MLVYLAGAVDAATPQNAKGWRENAREYLGDQGIASFSPVHAFDADFNVDEATAEAMIAINDHAVLMCNAVLANLSHRSFGTPLECELAIRHGRPVFAFGGSKRSIYRWQFTCYTGSLREALAELNKWPMSPSGVRARVPGHSMFTLRDWDEPA